MIGELYIVSTPIGNLDDISKRAIDTLQFVDIIAAEDSRMISRILKKYNLSKKIVSYNNYNEITKTARVIEFLKSGLNVALVSNAGTPTISDPGDRLVNQSILERIKVVSIPGPCSVIAALSISGLPTDKFYFEGFLPKKKGRLTRFDFLLTLDCTIVIFESPYRVLKTLDNISEKLGNRVISIIKEITKIHESVFYGYINDIRKNFDRSKIKGEFIILVAKEDYTISE